MHERITTDEGLRTFVRSREKAIESDNGRGTGSNLGWGGASGTATVRNSDIMLVMLTGQPMMIS
jgi:hypothetical protein